MAQVSILRPGLFRPVGMTRGGRLLSGRVATRMDGVRSGYSAVLAPWGYVFPSRLTQRPELQRGRVHAVAQTCRWRTVIENVTQVPVTTSAGDSRALTETPIFRGDYIFRRNWLPETGPAGPRIKFGLGRKKRCVTANTAVDPLLVQIPVGAGVGHFRIGPAGDVEGVRRELLSPLCVAFDYFLHPDFP